MALLVITRHKRHTCLNIKIIKTKTASLRIKIIKNNNRIDDSTENLFIIIIFNNNAYYHRLTTGVNKYNKYNSDPRKPN